jgi:hypothetical protein
MTRIAKPCGDTSKTVRQQPLAAFLGRAAAANLHSGVVTFSNK